MEACQLLTMMTALRRRNGLHRYVAEGRIVGEILSKQIRAGASKCIPGALGVMGLGGDWLRELFQAPMTATGSDV